ncbi:hypothetical protein P5663_09140 [Priestia flexa]|uniref:hypothetical protein n=1 Tax=Priestia flexa TaxID=86664 RepID=UPI00240E4EDA|nr:hypothetical protein [Priestia flexa]WEZ09984.1 hypothetical protein P5663_09140 [Priestia flexa]
MEVQVKMINGLNFETVIEGYDAQVLTETLNNQEYSMVIIGDVIAQRYSVTRVMPKVENQEANVEITLNDNTVIKVYVENYNPLTVLQSINSASGGMVAIGEAVLQASQIVRIMRIKQEAVA